MGVTDVGAGEVAADVGVGVGRVKHGTHEQCVQIRLGRLGRGTCQA